MSDRTEPQDHRAHLTSLGRLKLATRFIRYGQSLAPEEYKVLLFVFDRTISWENAFAAISESDFLNGVSSGRPGELACLPLGLSSQVIRAALLRLETIGAIRCHRHPSRTFYELNFEWTAPGLRRMWELEESDYSYPGV